MVEKSLITKDMKLIKPDKNRNYWIAEDVPFQGFGLTASQAIENLEQKIWNYFYGNKFLAR